MPKPSNFWFSLVRWGQLTLPCIVLDNVALTALLSDAACKDIQVRCWPLMLPLALWIDSDLATSAGWCSGKETQGPGDCASIPSAHCKSTGEWHCSCDAAWSHCCELTFAPKPWHFCPAPSLSAHPRSGIWTQFSPLFRPLHLWEATPGFGMPSDTLQSRMMLTLADQALQAKLTGLLPSE